MDTATFIYMMLVLKLPILALLWIVWWAIKSTPDVDSGDDDGGLKTWPHGDRPSPKPHPRRGPHGDPAPPSPSRVRTTVAQGRESTHT